MFVSLLFCYMCYALQYWRNKRYYYCCNNYINIFYISAVHIPFIVIDAKCHFNKIFFRYKLALRMHERLEVLFHEYSETRTIADFEHASRMRSDKLSSTYNVHVEFKTSSTMFLKCFSLLSITAKQNIVVSDCLHFYKYNKNRS